MSGLNFTAALVERLVLEGEDRRANEVQLAPGVITRDRTRHHARVRWSPRKVKLPPLTVPSGC